jgi:hypothetical protein
MDWSADAVEDALAPETVLLRILRTFRCWLEVGLEASWHTPFSAAQNCGCRNRPAVCRVQPPVREFVGRVSAGGDQCWRPPQYDPDW